MFLASLMAIGDAAQDALAIPLQTTPQGGGFFLVCSVLA